MLIDYLEQSTAHLREKEEQRLSLERQLRNFYSRDIKEEVVLIQAEIKKLRIEVIISFYENIGEYILLRKHYSALLEEYFTDRYIGKILSRKKWILEFEPGKQRDSGKELEKIKKERKQLREARGFLKKWVGKIDSKSLVATWKSLKDIIKDGMERDEAMNILHERSCELRKKGWAFLLHDSLILIPLRMLVSRLLEERKKEKEMLAQAESKRGRGSVEEYKSLSELRKANSRMMKTERMVRHLLLSNRWFLSSLKKKSLTGGNRIDRELQEIANTIYVKKIEEKTWLKEMKKRLS